MPTASRIQVLHQAASPFWLVQIDGVFLRDNFGDERQFITSYAAFMAGWEVLRRKGCAFDQSMEKAADRYR
jgi:hypothetical protein